MAATYLQQIKKSFGKDTAFFFVKKEIFYKKSLQLFKIAMLIGRNIAATFAAQF